MADNLKVYFPEGPSNAVVTMRNGKNYTAKLANRWGFDQRRSNIVINAKDILHLYQELIKLCYLTPLSARFIKPGLFLYNLYGRTGLNWVRKQLNRDF